MPPRLAHTARRAANSALKHVAVVTVRRDAAHSGLRSPNRIGGRRRIAATDPIGRSGMGQGHLQPPSRLRCAPKLRTVGIESRLKAAPRRKIARGWPLSMSQPNSSGDTIPPRLNPVVTNPNTL